MGHGFNQSQHIPHHARKSRLYIVRLSTNVREMLYFSRTRLLSSRGPGHHSLQPGRYRFMNLVLEINNQLF